MGKKEKILQRTISLQRKEIERLRSLSKDKPRWKDRSKIHKLTKYSRELEEMLMAQKEIIASITIKLGDTEVENKRLESIITELSKK